MDKTCLPTYETWLPDEEARVVRLMRVVGWQGTSRAHGYATLREMTRTSETQLRKSGRALTSHRRSAEAARYFRWK
jgi:hypothetical protein